MSTVTKHGKYAKKERCKECGCEFTYTSKDVHSVYLGWDSVRYVPCPECGHHVDL